MLAPSPRVLGYVPCGACREFVVKCPHYKPGGGKDRPSGVSSMVTPADHVRQAVVQRAGGYCETCGRQAVLLHVRAISLRFYYGHIRLDNAVAVCGLCRGDAKGLSIKEWIDKDPYAPVLARNVIEERIRKDLPV